MIAATDNPEDPVSVLNGTINIIAERGEVVAMIKNICDPCNDGKNDTLE
jgi:hypothetical protein